ncbi:MAG TPA: response regulator [Kofleriaceae bacterium]|nr:response regulator [Kofleriaceae bacterium]
MSESILIVEDDRELAAALVDALRAAGMARPVVVCDGVEALTWLHSHSPRVVLLDLHLPRADGEEIWSYMQADDDLRDVPTIVITGAADPALAHFQGVSEILRKPVPLERLVAAIKRVLPASPA